MTFNLLFPKVEQNPHFIKVEDLAPPFIKVDKVDWKFRY
jgi:hypothetical protein